MSERRMMISKLYRCACRCGRGFYRAASGRRRRFYGNHRIEAYRRRRRQGIVAQAPLDPVAREIFSELGR